MKNIIFAVFLMLGYCFAADSGKCSMNDSKCQLDNFMALKKVIAPVGIKEFGVPKIVPLHLSNVVVPAMSILNLTLVDGECQGLDTCTLTKYETDWDNLIRVMDMQCQRIIIQGNYEISSDPKFPFIKVSGTGYGSIVIDDWRVLIEFPFGLSKHDTGDVFFMPRFNETKWVSKVRKNVTITADNILVNNQNVTKSVIEYINKNWEIVLDTFGLYFHKISLDFLFEILEKIYNNMPVSGTFIEDLTPYI